MSRLEGRRVLVVGAGQQDWPGDADLVGNGRAIAVVAAREGASVLCADIDLAAAEATADVIRSEGGVAEAIDVDVADVQQCSALGRRSIEAMGSIDGLVYNVGIAQGQGILEVSLDEWTRTFDVNLRGAFLVTQSLLPLVSDGGSIVFGSSVGGLASGSGFPAYDASKSAMHGLSRHIALECGPRIRCNSVAYGLIDTPMHRLADEERARSDSSRVRGGVTIPLGRKGTGWEVAKVVTFLLSDDASYVSGQTLAVDGGFSSTLPIISG